MIEAWEDQTMTRLAMTRLAMTRLAMTGLAALIFAVLAFMLASGPLEAKPPMGGARAKSDYVTATKTVIPRAERGDANAQARLGFMYEHGRGVPQDYGLAVYWYTCAAAQGHATGQYLLGLMYDKGLGIVRSDILAYMWLNLATANAPPRTREYYSRIRDALAAKLSPAQVAEAQSYASTFVPAP
jgi:TPR repeat protein